MARADGAVPTGTTGPRVSTPGGIHREGCDCAVELIGNVQKLSVGRDCDAGGTGAAGRSEFGNPKWRTGHRRQSRILDREYRNRAGSRIDLQSLVGYKEKVSARVHGHAQRRHSPGRGGSADRR